MNNTQKFSFLKYDAAYISDPSNLFYLTNYKNDDARIIITKNENLYISDKRVEEEFKNVCPHFRFVDIGEGGGYVQKSLDCLDNFKIKRIGYEDLSILNHEYSMFKGFKLLPISKEIQKIRSIKEEKELLLIESAQKITDLVFLKILDFIKVGISEIELECFINSQIFLNGGTLAFDTIVAFGQNTSRPHAHPSHNVLRERDIITIDFGAKYNGYCSDMTRSIAFGKPENDYIYLYQLVLEAQKASLDKLKAGMSGAECDALARNYFAKYNMDSYFTHSLGHSLGIDIHEKPLLSRFYKGIIETNVITSVEPGLYLPNKFGVRIEDIVVFCQDGVRNLTKSPKELIIL
ncbi:MAG: Xaa-Pro dipeptidase [Firmicutes bacterium ADurb.Bin080]|jgi:Xaa-Pro aminopeptidase|nr:aminopeptidase P family protein [Clostridiales bacterium]OQC16435.1 MAG: Xaa-Pro dipeptidase [Firmicutes bacterium ADurb.Bin080]